MQMETLLAVYCVFIVFASVMGGWLPTVIRMTHLRTQLMMSFVAGLMLGIAMLHMLPHAVELMGSASLTGDGGTRRNHHHVSVVASVSYAPTQ